MDRLIHIDTNIDVYIGMGIDIDMYVDIVVEKRKEIDTYIAMDIGSWI